MKYDGTNFEEVIEAHNRWASLKTPSKEEDKADFSGADLTGKDLSGLYLYKVSFKYATMKNTKLHGAYLHGANFEYADMEKAKLDDAYLHGANFNYAVMCEASMTHTCCSSASFIAANMKGVDLKDADIREAYFDEADLYQAKNVPFIPMVCPDTGAFIGWKACRGRNNYAVIVKLLIPEDAKRSSATGRKCRCDKAVVLDIQRRDGTKAKSNKAFSFYCDLPLQQLQRVRGNNGHTVYEIGKTVLPKSFCEDRWKECAPGIHFFVNREEAVKYGFG